MCVWVCVHVYVFGSLDRAVRRTLWLTAAIFALYFIRLLALTAQRGNFSSINNYTGETFWNVTLKQFHILGLTLISPLKAFVVVQLLSRIWLFVTPWAAAHQASLSITISQSLLKLMFIESVLPSNHLILCCPLLSCLQSFPASGAFPMSQFFTSCGQSMGVSASASVLPMNIQDWFPLGWTDWISLQSKGFSRVFSNTTVQKHQFFSAQPSLLSNSHIHTWLLEKP